MWLIEGVFSISVSKPRLIIFSKICICFKLKPAAESNWRFVLGASDRKNKGGLVGLLDLNSLICSVRFMLTETTGDSHQTIPSGAPVLPIVWAHSATNRRWCIWSSRDFDYPQMLDVVAGKIEEMLEQSLQKGKQTGESWFWVFFFLSHLCVLLSAQKLSVMENLTLQFAFGQSYWITTNTLSLKNLIFFLPTHFVVFIASFCCAFVSLVESCWNFTPFAGILIWLVSVFGCSGVLLWKIVSCLFTSCVPLVILKVSFLCLL